MQKYFLNFQQNGRVSAEHFYKGIGQRSDSQLRIATRRRADIAAGVASESLGLGGAREGNGFD
jgi:hypothetical protein